MIRPIIKYPENILCDIACPIIMSGVEYVNQYNELGVKFAKLSTEEIQAIIEDMRDTAKSVPWGKCVGLAAPQIGRSVRIILVLDSVYINPQLVWSSPKISTQKEGCYSLEENNFSYETQRAKSVEVEWQDVTGKPHRKRFHRFEAQVMQHEIDHLNGVSCVAPKVEKVKEIA